MKNFTLMKKWIKIYIKNCFSDQPYIITIKSVLNEPYYFEEFVRWLADEKGENINYKLKKQINEYGGTFINYDDCLNY